MISVGDDGSLGHDKAAEVARRSLLLGKSKLQWRDPWHSGAGFEEGSRTTPRFGDRASVCMELLLPKMTPLCKRIC